MAFVIASGRVRTKVSAELCEKTFKLRLIGRQRHTTLVCSVPLWYWTSMLSLIDTRHNKVISTLLPYRVPKFRAHRGPNFFLEADCWASSGFRLDLRRMSDPDRFVSKPVNANSEFKINRNSNFSWHYLNKNIRQKQCKQKFSPRS